MTEQSQTFKNADGALLSKRELISIWSNAIVARLVVQDQ
jgi:hypothetical protein